MNPSVLNGFPGVDTSHRFPRAKTTAALDARIYDELEAGRVELDQRYFGASGGDNKLRLVPASVLLKDTLPALWREFVQYHISPAFRDDVWRLFGDSIVREHPHLNRAHKWPVLTRREASGFGKRDRCLIADCQLAIDTPARTTNRVRGPHVDNPTGLFVCLVYMRPVNDTSEGGDLILYRHRDPEHPAFQGKAELADDSVDELGRVCYQRNSGVAWVNSLHSIHGVSPRVEGSGRRLFVNILLECPGRNFLLA